MEINIRQVYVGHRENIVWNDSRIKPHQTKKEFIIYVKEFDVCVVEAIGKFPAGEIYNLIHYLKRKLKLWR